MGRCLTGAAGVRSASGGRAPRSAKRAARFAVATLGGEGGAAFGAPARRVRLRGRAGAGRFRRLWLQRGVGGRGASIWRGRTSLGSGLPVSETVRKSPPPFGADGPGRGPPPRGGASGAGFRSRGGWMGRSAADSPAPGARRMRRSGPRPSNASGPGDISPGPHGRSAQGRISCRDTWTRRCNTRRSRHSRSWPSSSGRSGSSTRRSPAP